MKNIKICPTCEAESKFKKEQRKEEYNVRGMKFTTTMTIDVCIVCNESLYDEKQEQRLVEKAYAQYREEKGLLSPKEIQSIRKKYSLSQKSFAILLGMSEATINRYENGGLQDIAHDALIHANNKSEIMKDLIERRGHLLKPKQLNKVEAALSEMIKQPFQNKINTLYSRLREAGLNKKYIRDVILPSWWDDEEERQTSSIEKITSLIANHFGIDLSMLNDDSFPIQPSRYAFQYKTRKDISKGDLRWSSHIAAQVSKIACKAIPSKPIELPKAADDIRNIICKDKDHNSCVNLDNLLDYCWLHAIPVIHLTNYPTGSKKMDGLTGYIDGRPVIVISKSIKYSAWLLFILAHEIGHLICGHIQDDVFLVDDKVEKECDDSQENEANAFATELLTGDPNTQYVPSGNRLTGPELAKAAKQKSEKDKVKVDAGFIALNYAWVQQFFPVANASLKIIEPKADAPGEMRKKMIDYLEWDELEEEEAQFLLRITDQPS
ncbi:MAG: type II TA system antitoxin MqsA family protein [Planctomycetota bacterium]|jgi:putative zinc finger/helix-turn-helix YgiT family protein